MEKYITFWMIMIEKMKIRMCDKMIIEYEDKYIEEVRDLLV